MSDLNIQCPHFSVCSGCSLAARVNHPPIFDDMKRFFMQNGIFSFNLHAGHPTGWRCRAKLAVRGTSSSPLLGLFEEGSHRVVDIPQCQVHHPANNTAVGLIKEWIVQEQITPYDEQTGQGLLRYLQLTVERSSGRVQLSLVLNRSKDNHSLSKQIEMLWQKHPKLWHSIWLNFNTSCDNVIFGNDWVHCYGEKWLWESLLGIKICFHPASFMQANLDMFESLLIQLKSWLPDKANVLEIYAGVGAIGFAISSQCHRVHCIERNPLAKQCFEETVRQLPLEASQRMFFDTGSAKEFASKLNQCKQDNSVVIVDPPRKGLDSQLLKNLCQAEISRFIYVSCGWDSFKRDCHELQMHGWKLVYAEGFLFFPGSDHLETLAVFDKSC